MPVVHYTYLVLYINSRKHRPKHNPGFSCLLESLNIDPRSYLVWIQEKRKAGKFVKLKIMVSRSGAAAPGKSRKVIPVTKTRRITDPPPCLKP